MTTLTLPPIRVDPALQPMNIMVTSHRSMFKSIREILYLVEYKRISGGKDQ